jgi:hypothetical protein
MGKVDDVMRDKAQVRNTFYRSPPEDPALQGWGCMALWLAVW